MGFFGRIFKVTKAALRGAALGATVGSAVPVLGTVAGAVVGAVAGGGAEVVRTRPAAHHGSATVEVEPDGDRAGVLGLDRAQPDAIAASILASVGLRAPFLAGYPGRSVLGVVPVPGTLAGELVQEWVNDPTLGDKASLSGHALAPAILLRLGLLPVGLRLHPDVVWWMGQARRSSSDWRRVCAAVGVA